MKKIIIAFSIFISLCYAEDISMDARLKNGIEYYFEQVIPAFNGSTFDEKKSYQGLLNYGIHMQGLEGGVDYFMNTQNLIFDFYYLINHDKQSVQGMMIASEEKNDYLYEYWIFKIADHGTPYNYAYFYLTKAETKESKRKIINISKKYVDTYTLENGEILDLTIHNPAVVYQVVPQWKLESFSGTKYENMIISWWTGKKPYLRKMNFLEILYYRYFKKNQNGKGGRYRLFK